MCNSSSRRGAATFSLAKGCLRVAEEPHDTRNHRAGIFSGARVDMAHRHVTAPPTLTVHCACVVIAGRLGLLCFFWREDGGASASRLKGVGAASEETHKPLGLDTMTCAGGLTAPRWEGGNGGQ